MSASGLDPRQPVDTLRDVSVCSRVRLQFPEDGERSGRLTDGFQHLTQLVHQGPAIFNRRRGTWDASSSHETALSLTPCILAHSTEEQPGLESELGRANGNLQRLDGLVEHPHLPVG